ncbi:MAG: tRNA guanosine(34) transglycosylase Tgt [Chloroflexi bacterium]|nr:tRNA guanosine(34) transglycosylase Tgt [Chloroflexota bacterium]
MAALSFTLTHTSARSAARAGVIQVPHGRVETPAFMVVGTQATVKSLTPADLRELGVQIVLANTYHLSLRPGAELVARLGGLHHFMGWDGPLITDSGGYQVFSLGFALEHGVGKQVGMFPAEAARGGGPRPAQGQKPKLARVDDDGVTFTSHLDGSTHRLTPERSIDIQQQLGADIILAFDEPTSPLHDYDYTRQALERTHRWADRCLAAKTRADQALFGIVQGGAFRDLREESARFMAARPIEGFAIGGSLGKSKQDMHAILEWTVPLLAEDRPRHLLGIGEPEDLLEAVERGIDLFDCVAPTRYARHGVLYTHRGKLTLTNAVFREDPGPIEPGCTCSTCARFSRAYLRHLFVAEELLSYRLATIHNLHFILSLVRQARQAILDDNLAAYREQFLQQYLSAEC